MLFWMCLCLPQHICGKAVELQFLHALLAHHFENYAETLAADFAIEVLVV